MDLSLNPHNNLNPQENEGQIEIIFCNSQHYATKAVKAVKGMFQVLRDGTEQHTVFHSVEF